LVVYKTLRHFSGNRVIDSVYQNYTLMNTHEHWRHMFCTNIYLTTQVEVFPLNWWDNKCTGYVGGFILLKQGNILESLLLDLYLEEFYSIMSFYKSQNFDF